jgi:Tol biopolymer transport system component
MSFTKKQFLVGFFVANTLLIYSLLAISGGSASAGPTASLTKTEAASAEIDPGLMTQARQLTFVGARAGEGYFSADGKKMIFQSERLSGNPFYQIFMLDLKTGITEMISTGDGKTTCAWVHPAGKKALFASTHEDTELKKKVEEEYALRKSPQKNKYSWSFDETFDIYERELKTKKLKRLTRDKGYDAEGSYSPDGKWIAFASNRAAYSEKLGPEDAKLFQQDPSYMMDIYIMKADGTQVRQLTDVKGYDGGPFFSADGKKITWRRFTPNGQSAEIMTMNTDGTEQKQLTHLKAMSWAPYFHPSGDYLIFTTNKLGFSNFELYIVDSAGLREPVRVSYVPDFDGLPVFSPNGEEISWTHRNEKGESQIYMAQWNDKKARELLGLPKKNELKLSSLTPEISAKDIHSIISYLASENLKGRKTGSSAEKIYTATLAEIFSELGLQPLAQKSFLSPFEFTSSVELGAKNTLEFEVNGEKLAGQVGVDFIPLSMSKAGSFPKGPVAFGGYGIQAAASDKEAAYDSFKSLDVKGKWVLMFRDIPEGISNEKRIHLNLFSRLQNKVLVAKQAGAIGVMIATGPNSPSQQKLMKLRYEGVSADAGLPVVSLSNEFAEKLIKPTGRGLKQWQDVLDKGEIQSADIPKTFASAELDLKFLKSTGLNVVGKLSVKGATETLVIGAHGDHLGQGDLGSSLAKAGEQGLVHYGADDNASGVAGVIELAQWFSTQHRLGQLKLKKNLVFAIWSGEEIGLLGSTDWVKKQKTEKITSYLNMDMIGRLKDKLSIQGVGSAKEWKALFEQLATQTDLDLSLTDDPYLPTDSMAFYLQSIPTVSFFTGAHAEYHSPRDKVELINTEGEARILALMQKLILRLAGSTAAPTRLTYIKSESSQRQLQGRSFRVFLGTIPDYVQDGVKGVKISGTSKDSPAEKAGLVPGDVIVELSGLKIDNLYDYVYGLQSLKANQTAVMKVQRQGKLEELKITPVLKE